MDKYRITQAVDKLKEAIEDWNKYPSLAKSNVEKVIESLELDLWVENNSTKASSDNRFDYSLNSIYA